MPSKKSSEKSKDWISNRFPLFPWCHPDSLQKNLDWWQQGLRFCNLCGYFAMLASGGPSGPLDAFIVEKQKAGFHWYVWTPEKSKKGE